MNYDFSDPRFLEAINKFRPTESNLADHPKLKILKTRHLDEYWKSQPNHLSALTLCIKESDLDHLDFKEIAQNLSEITKGLGAVNNLLEVNCRFEICSAKRLSFGDSTGAKHFMKTLSRDGYCIFFLGPRGVDMYIQGDNILELNVFYCAEDLRRYSERAHISELRTVLRTYGQMYLSRKRQTEHT